MEINMKFECSYELRQYMEEKGKNTIAVEVITSDYSDFEISELHVHLIDEKQAQFFKNKKRYASVQTEFGEVLLPPFRLKCEDTISFDLKKRWIFNSISYTGIHSLMN
jgi:hypothetical protein